LKGAFDDGGDGGARHVHTKKIIGGRKMKKKLLAGLALGVMMISGAGVASANIVEYVNLQFASGAQWNGTITFNDGYQGMIGTDGYVTGGAYDGIYFTWTWLHGMSQANPFDSDGDGLYNDWLVEELAGFGAIIGLSWDAATSVTNNAITFTLLDDAYYSGLDAGDLLVSYNTNPNPVPVPAAMVLLGSGLAGLAGARLRRKK
jgi:hypothetical protein